MNTPYVHHINLDKGYPDHNRKVQFIYTLLNFLDNKIVLGEETHEYIVMEKLCRNFDTCFLFQRKPNHSDLNKCVWKNSFKGSHMQLLMRFKISLIDDDINHLFMNKEALSNTEQKNCLPHQWKNSLDDDYVYYQFTRNLDPIIKAIGVEINIPVSVIINLKRNNLITHTMIASLEKPSKFIMDQNTYNIVNSEDNSAHEASIVYVAPEVAPEVTSEVSTENAPEVIPEVTSVATAVSEDEFVTSHEEANDNGLIEETNPLQIQINNLHMQLQMAQDEIMSLKIRLIHEMQKNVYSGYMVPVMSYTN